MLDTHAIARSLTDAGADPKLADAITNAVLQATQRAAAPVELIEGVYYAKTDAKEALTRLDALVQYATEHAHRAEQLSMEVRVRIERLEALSNVDQRLARLEGIITGRGM